jgi:hypothetical protein
MQSTHGIQVESRVPHEALCTAIASDRTHKDVRDFGGILDRMRVRRVQADYKLRQPFTEFSSDDTVEDALEVLRWLGSVADRLPRVEAA